MSEKEEDFRPRRKLLVDRTFQSRFFATWLTIAFWVALALSLFYIGGTWGYIQLHEDPTKWSAEQYQQAVRYFVAGNIVFILFLIVLIGVSALLHSHRIAGATYRIKADLQRFRSGQYLVDVRLRPKDFLHDLAQEVNETLAHVRTRMREKERQLELAKDLLQTLKDAPGVPHELAEMIADVDGRIDVKRELALESIDPDEGPEEDGEP